MAEPDFVLCRTAIERAFPNLAASTFKLVTTGWHSMAIDADDRLIFKFPRHDIAEKALLKEAALLAVIRPSLTMAVPDLSIHDGPPLFSFHEKLQGRYFLAADYAGLPQHARQRLGEDLAGFYAELHQLDFGQVTAAGATAIASWQTPDAIRSKALPILPPELSVYAEDAIAAFERLPPDPYGETYGFFDGHGWNMAFDHARCRLNGIYDFADSGIGPLHQEFIYSNFISRDLTERIVTAYETLTGRRLDRRRIELLTGIHRLSELAELADEPEYVAAMIENVATWVAATARS